jgi:hypothetical protein
LDNLFQLEKQHMLKELFSSNDDDQTCDPTTNNQKKQQLQGFTLHSSTGKRTNTLTLNPRSLPGVI